MQRIYEVRGFKGFYRGMMATVYREVPGYGGQVCSARLSPLVLIDCLCVFDRLQFFLYEWLKQKFTKKGRHCICLCILSLLSVGFVGLFVVLCSDSLRAEQSLPLCPAPVGPKSNAKARARDGN